MKQFEKHIKERFEDAGSLDGIHPNQLWANIQNELLDDSAGAASTSETGWRALIKRFKKRSGLMLLMLFLVLISTVIFVYQYADGNTQNISASAAFNPATIQNKNNAAPAIKTQNPLSTKTSEKTNKQIKQARQSAPNHSQLTIVTNTNSNKLISATSKESVSPLKLEVRELWDMTKKGIPDKRTALFTDLTPESLPSTAVLNNKPSINKQQQLFDKVPQNAPESPQILSTARIPFINLLKNDDRTFNDLIIKNTDPVGGYSQQKKTVFGVFLGTHTAFNYFGEGAVSSELRKSFSNVPGTSIGLEVKHDLNRTFDFKAGLEYMFTVERFNYSYARDTLITNMNFPGQSRPATATRNIQQHNKHSSFALPIMLGIKKESIRTNYGLRAGLGLNYINSQTGKVLEGTGEVITYPSSETGLSPRPKFHFSYHLQPYFTYRTSKQIAWQFRLDTRLHTYGNTGFYNTKHYTLLTGLNVGFIYSIK